VTGGYNFGSGWDGSAAYSNVQYIPGVGVFQSAPSSSRSQFAAGVGIVHRF
jgi:hypothetical protein